jgi:hypothetical protein
MNTIAERTRERAISGPTLFLDFSVNSSVPVINMLSSIVYKSRTLSLKKRPARLTKRKYTSNGTLILRLSFVVFSPVLHLDQYLSDETLDTLN